MPLLLCLHGPVTLSLRRLSAVHAPGRLLAAENTQPILATVRAVFQVRYLGMRVWRIKVISSHSDAAVPSAFALGVREGAARMLI